MWFYLYIVILLALIVACMFANPKHRKSKGEKKNDDK